MIAAPDRPGTRCEHRGCDRPATYLVHWPPAQLMPMCPEHAADAKRMNFEVEPIR